MSWSIEEGWTYTLSVDHAPMENSGHRTWLLLIQLQCDSLEDRQSHSMLDCELFLSWSCFVCFSSISLLLPTLHPHVNVLSRVTPWTAARQAPLCPWTFPGRNTGGGCCFCLQAEMIFKISESDFLGERLPVSTTWGVNHWKGAGSLLWSGGGRGGDGGEKQGLPWAPRWPSRTGWAALSGPPGPESGLGSPGQRAHWCTCPPSQHSAGVTQAGRAKEQSIGWSKWLRRPLGYHCRSTNPKATESESEVAQSCLTLCDPMDCSPPGSSIQGIF